MNTRTPMQAASCLLAAACLFTVAATADTSAAQRGGAASPETKPPLPSPVKEILPKKVLQIESEGARAFGGTRVYNPADPSGSRFLSCDHGYTDWQIPPGSRKNPLVFTHGSGTRVYQTTFDGRPGMQQLFLGLR